VAGAKYWPHGSIYRLYTFQWGEHELRYKWKECQFKQHNLPGCAIRFLKFTEDDRNDSRPVDGSNGGRDLILKESDPGRFVILPEILASVMVEVLLFRKCEAKIFCRLF
jgi:hypothetical protein